MRLIRTLFGFVLGINLVSVVSVAELVVENDLVRWTIGDNGQNKSLIEKSTGQQLLATPGGHMFAVRKGNQTFEGTVARSEGERVQVVFGESGIKAEYRIIARPRYFVVELVRVSGDGVDEVRLAEILSSVRGRFGGTLNVAWNDRFTVCIMALGNRVHSATKRAVVYREYGMEGQKAVIIAVPTSQFLDVVREVEQDWGLPSPTIGGKWAKASDDVRTSYLFADMTEANADELIRLARLGEFKYIMMFGSTWSSSWGTAPINPKSFPNGEAGLKAVVEKCHAAGLKVGIHTMTSMIAKRDPLVHPKPDPRLLKNIWATLVADIDAESTEIPAVESLADWPGQPAYYGALKQGMDIQLDDEIIQYRQIGGRDGRVFLECLRGQSGTQAAPHKAGARIGHLAQWFSSYIADLRTSLKDDIAERIAGLINRCGLDMLYLDGNNGNILNGPRWHWATLQETSIWERLRRDVLIQTGGMTHWTWHFQTRGTCNDFAALAAKQYLDYHKIPDAWQGYTSNFMPAELGWWGFLADDPAYPATSPDEVELYAVRMLALDCPVSLETFLVDLKRHGRTDELLSLLGKYERLRLARAVPDAIRQKLRKGEWHMVETAGKPVFHPVRYDVHRVTTPGEVRVNNTFHRQPLNFRLRVVPELAAPGDPNNKVLFHANPPATPRLPSADAAMPGALAAGIKFAKPSDAQQGAFVVGPNSELTVAKGAQGLDLLRHRALAVRLRVEGTGEPCPVLNVQLESVAKMYRDHYINLDFTGERTIVIPEPTADRMLAEFRPHRANYSFKHAGYLFKYEAVTGLNFRWMRVPKGTQVRCAVSLVEALKESDASLLRPSLTIQGRRIEIPGKLRTGDYAEFWTNGPIRIFDRNWKPLRSMSAASPIPILAPGENCMELSADTSAPLKLTVITLGAPLQPQLSSKRRTP